MPRRRLCTGGRRPGAFRSLGARALEKDDALMIVKIISASCTVAVKVPAQALGLRPWLAALPLRERRLRARLLMGVTPSVVRWRATAARPVRRPLSHSVTAWPSGRTSAAKTQDKSATTRQVDVQDLVKKASGFLKIALLRAS
jgi:hypothetical protein